MHLKLALFSAIAGFVSLSSAGSAVVLNKCPFTVYLWSATPTATSQRYVLPAGNGRYSEAYQALPYGGVALKISRYSDISALYNGSALMQDQYTLDGALVWYNLADTGGDPFLGYRVTLVPSGSGQNFVWPNGQGPSQILNTASSNNLTLTVCA